MATATLEPEVSTQFEAEKQEALQVANQAKLITVKDNESFIVAGEMLRAVVGRLKQWKDLIAPAKESAHQAHKNICTLEKTVADPLTAVETHLRGQISKYTAEQERIRRTEEARLQEIQRKAAEEEERKRAEAAQVEAALEAEKAGDTKAAEEIIAAPVEVAPVFVPPVILQSSVPKIAGLTTRKTIKFRIVDVAKIPTEFMIPDETKIGKYGRAMGAQAVIPGVEFYEEDSPVVR